MNSEPMPRNDQPSPSSLAGSHSKSRAWNGQDGARPREVKLHRKTPTQRSRVSAKRIGVFQLACGFQNCSRDLVSELAKRGYGIDLFIDENSLTNAVVDLSELRNLDVRIFIFRNRRSSRLTAIRSMCDVTLTKILRLPINWRAVMLARTVLSGNHDKYCAFIGIEKLGLIWAGLTVKHRAVPLIYYSLELYFEGSERHTLGWAIPYERTFHRRCKATIVQDPLRARELLNHNGVVGQSVIHFPVSARGGAKEIAGRAYWHEAFSIPRSARVILYLGLLSTKRDLEDLLFAARSLPGNRHFVLHGPCLADDGSLEQLREKINALGLSNVHLSTKLVPEAKLSELIASADIGLCMYNNHDVNDRLTAFSSQKVAAYLQHGIPLIAFRNESYEALFGEFACGEMIDDLCELPLAVRRIIGAESMYRKAAFNAFDRHFDFDKNVEGLVERLEAAVFNGPGDGSVQGCAIGPKQLVEEE